MLQLVYRIYIAFVDSFFVYSSIELDGVSPPLYIFLIL